MDMITVRRGRTPGYLLSRSQPRKPHDGSDQCALTLRGGPVFVCRHFALAPSAAAEWLAFRRPHKTELGPLSIRPQRFGRL
jgi:hypothetical protein